MIHIVFNEPDVAVLEKAIALDESLKGDVVLIRDDYAVGPLEDIYSGTGLSLRRDWWGQVAADTEFAAKVESGEVDDPKTIAGVVGRLRRNEEEEVWIWAAQNKHDVSGYYFVLHYLREFPGRIFILYLNNLPLLMKKEDFFILNG